MNFTWTAENIAASSLPKFSAVSPRNLDARDTPPTTQKKKNNLLKASSNEDMYAITVVTKCIDIS